MSEYGTLLMKFFDAHSPPMPLHTSAGQKVAKAPSEVTIIHCINNRIQHGIRIAEPEKYLAHNDRQSTATGISKDFD